MILVASFKFMLTGQVHSHLTAAKDVSTNINCKMHKPLNLLCFCTINMNPMKLATAPQFGFLRLLVLQSSNKRIFAISVHFLFSYACMPECLYKVCEWVLWVLFKNWNLDHSPIDHLWNLIFSHTFFFFKNGTLSLSLNFCISKCSVLRFCLCENKNSVWSWIRNWWNIWSFCALTADYSTFMCTTWINFFTLKNWTKLPSKII